MYLFWRTLQKGNTKLMSKFFRFIKDIVLPDKVGKERRKSTLVMMLTLLSSRTLSLWLRWRLLLGKNYRKSLLRISWKRRGRESPLRGSHQTMTMKNQMKMKERKKKKVGLYNRLPEIYLKKDKMLITKRHKSIIITRKGRLLSVHPTSLGLQEAKRTRN